MASLTGNLISDSYSGLLKTTDNGTITSVTKSITDGLGNATALSLSTTSASIAGNLTINGTLNATASSATTASYALTTTTASFAISASNANLLDGLDSTVFATTGSNTFTGTQVVSGSLRLFESASFTLPTSQPATAVAGTAFFSGSFLYIYNGSVYKSASFN
jgi:hypothetical protein